jgi:hypothetical protein
VDKQKLKKQVCTCGVNKSKRSEVVECQWITWSEWISLRSVDQMKARAQFRRSEFRLGEVEKMETNRYVEERWIKGKGEQSGI